MVDLPVAMPHPLKYNKGVMARSAITITEISRRAGCSIATVSRVLNNSGAVSQKAREAVLKVMRETQFLATRAARHASAGAKKTGTGVVEIIQHRHSPVEGLTVDGGSLAVGPLTTPAAGYRSPLSNAFHRHIADGAVEELAKWGYRAQLRMNRNLVDPHLLADLNGPDRTGVLLIGEYSPDLSSFIDQCLHPLVLVDIIHQGPTDIITSDNFAGIGAVFDHLYSLGHRRIGFVGRSEVAAFSERFTAYKLKMIDAGLTIRPDWIYEGPDHIETTAAGVARILTNAQRPTALLCANDCYALGVVRAASNLGISIPGNLSITGFDDVDFAPLVTPPLTTVRVPLQEMGRQAVRQLMISIQCGTPARARGCQVRLIPDLVARQSTSAIR